jgi:hypothetical protein
MDSTSATQQRYTPLGNTSTPQSGSEASGRAPSQQQPHHHPTSPSSPPVFTQHQAYPLSVQQQPQGAWTPSITAPPFYPAFYQNQPQQQSQATQAYTSQTPYFDPNMTQWAYQQMMFNTHPPFSHQQPQRPGSNHPDYFAQSQPIPQFNNGFPSGTPPPPQHSALSREQQQYVGFHPYRRPSRQPSAASQENSDWRSAPTPPQRPYARTDASGSSSSVNSVGSRPRTDSNKSSNSARHVPAVANNNSISANARSRPAASSSGRDRSGSHASSPSASSNGPSPSATQRLPHHRNGSASSTTPSRTSSTSISSSHKPAPSSPSPPPSTSTNQSPAPQARPARPSPLSQGNFTLGEKRMSRDDIDLGTMLDTTTSATMVRSGGLKGRLRRALSFNPASTLGEVEEEKLRGTQAVDDTFPGNNADPPSDVHSSQGPGFKEDDGESTATVQTKKKSKAASLFSSRMNMSTDNISLSSTVSSASVMIRKLGSMGKLARRNSLAGITSLFKDKKDKEDVGKKGKKKSAKSEASEASVSHATAELDRGDWSASPPELQGLSPAAKLARQHTLKSNAEAAAKAKAQQEANDSRNNKTIGQPNSSAGGVPAWERNTATGQGSQSPMKGRVKVNEDGVLIEDDEEGTDEEDDVRDVHQQQQKLYGNSWADDDEDDWDAEGEEDMTIRQALDSVHLNGEDNDENDVEPWAIGIIKSADRGRMPVKSILKRVHTDQSSSISDSNGQHLTHRMRSNSYESHTGISELGPLARIPSPDPDHIDGLHRHGSHSSQYSSQHKASSPSGLVPTLPPLSFEQSSTDHSNDLLKEESSPTLLHSSSTTVHRPSPPPSALFTHPNSSAPTLSTLLPSSSSSPPAMAHRSATAPSKRLAFANNLSVYDTFPATVYDRRSEPATWSRLTPALAQRIKEELNSYKMEEMEVHVASRVHTQFFV